MPWRGTDDPYRIWISETMLQQTQVATVEAYYCRFVSRFPTVRALARADLGAVLKAWEGLGYYARGRNLHRAAQVMVRDFGGRVPDTAEGLASLPGVGRYTAGAVLAIAFGRPAAALDGNVIRVLSRLFRVEGDVRDRAVLARLWDLAGSLVPERGVRAHTEAMMELGAVVCTPRRPACGACPVSPHCLARRHGLQETLPRRAARPRPPHVHVTAGIVWKRGKFLITLRPPSGLLGGLWEFPGGKQEPGESLEACLRRELLEETGLRVRVGRRLVTVRHAYTHLRVTLHVYECRAGAGRVRLSGCAAHRWVTAAELDRYAFPAADRRVIRLLQENQSGGFE
jgi:A/G-specific adenine glycosylase